MYIAKANQSVNLTPERLAALRGRFIGVAAPVTANVPQLKPIAPTIA